MLHFQHAWRRAGGLGTVSKYSGIVPKQNMIFGTFLINIDMFFLQNLFFIKVLKC